MKNYSISIGGVFSALPRAVLAVVVAVLCWGCSSTPEGPPSGFRDSKGYQEEARAAYGTFEWPRNVGPSLDEILHQNRPQEGQFYQEGSAIVMMETVNSCAWYLSWNTAHQNDDSAAVTSALAVMADRIPRDAGAKEGPEVEKFYQEIARKASLGDGSGAVDFLRANCSWLLGEEDPNQTGGK